MGCRIGNHFGVCGGGIDSPATEDGGIVVASEGEDVGQFEGKFKPFMGLRLTQNAFSSYKVVEKLLLPTISAAGLEWEDC